jgi:hypothetical protein
MDVLNWVIGGQTVLIRGGGSPEPVTYDYSAESDDRFFGVIEDPVTLRVSASQRLKVDAPAESVELAKRRCEGLEIIALSESDRLDTVVVHESDDADQRSAIAKLQASGQVGHGHEWYDLRVSPVSLPHPADGLVRYDFAYKCRPKPTPFVGGTQVYP